MHPWRCTPHDSTPTLTQPRRPRDQTDPKPRATQLLHPHDACRKSVFPSICYRDEAETTSTGYDISTSRQDLKTRPNETAAAPHRTASSMPCTRPRPRQVGFLREGCKALLRLCRVDLLQSLTATVAQHWYILGPGRLSSIRERVSQQDPIYTRQRSRASCAAREKKQWRLAKRRGVLGDLHLSAGRERCASVYQRDQVLRLELLPCTKHRPKTRDVDTDAGGMMAGRWR